MKSPMIKDIQNQLNELAKAAPMLQDQEHEAGQLYSTIEQAVAQLSANVSRQGLTLKTLTAIAHLSGEIIETQDASQAAVKIIHEQLGLHYVGLFLLDETSAWAELRASSDKSSYSGMEDEDRLAIKGDSAVAQTIRHRKPLFTQKSDLPGGSGSELVLPLLSRGQITGALVLQSTSESILQLRAEDSVLLQGLADELANTVYNTNLFATVNRHLQQIITLHNINLRIGSQFNLKTLLENVALLSTKLMGADIGIVSLTDDEQKKLERKVTYRSPNLSSTETADGTLATLISEHVFQTGKGCLANNWPNHPLAAELVGTINLQTPSQAVLCVPMILPGKTIGTVEVQSLTKPEAFNENDLYLLSLLSAQAAAAIENTQLFTQAENNRRFLKTVIEHIPDPIFIKDRNHTLIAMNRANAEVIGLPEQEIIGKTDYDFFPPELAAKFQQRDNEVFESNQPYVAEDKTVWADGQEHIAYTRLIPIPDNRGLPQYMLGITQDVTERKAQETERERLLAETAALYQGNRAIATALSERQIFEALFEQIRRQDPCEIAAYQFNLVKDEPIWAELSASWQKRNTPSYPVGTHFHLPENPLARLLTTREPIFIDDIAADPRLSEAERESFGPTGACSVALLPVAATGQELGVIFVYFTRPYTFSEEVKRLWLALTDQVGISLLNRRLIQGTAYRAVQIDTAAEVARAASSVLDLQELLNATVALIRDRFELYYVGVFLVDQAKEWAILRAGTGEAGRIQLKKGHRLKIGGDSMIGWAVKNRQARIALDVGKEAVHFQNPDLLDTRSEMAIPLIHRNEVIGALTIQSTEQAAFSRTDIIILQTMSDQLAIAIENASLFTKAQESETTTRAILNAIPDLMVRLSKDGTYLDVRGPTEIKHVAPVEEVTGKTILDILPAKIAQQYQQLINQALQSGEPQIFEYDFAINGRTCQFEARIVVSGPEEVLAIVRDITERKQAEREILRRNEELAAINRVTAVVTSALDMQVILQGAAREMVQIFEARGCGIALLSPNRNELSVVAFHSSNADEASTEGLIIPVANNPSSRQVIETGRSIVVSDAQHNALTAPIHNILRELKTECLMIVPLLARGEVIGTIGLDLVQPDREFSPEEVALAETIAGQIASTIDNARLFEQMEASLREREQVERALRSSEKQYRQLVESANSIILRLNTRGQVTFLNRFGQDFLGFTEDDILGKYAVGTIVPKTESSGRDLTAMMEDILKNPDLYLNNENENLCSDGSRVWVLWTNKAILDDEGNLDEILCIGNDVTKHKKAEERLAAERNLLQTLIDNIPDYIYIKDTNSRFLLNNLAHLQLLRAKAQDELIGKTDFDIFPEEVAAKYFADEQEVLQSGQPLLRKRETTPDAKGDLQWLSTTKVPLRDNQENIIGLVGISRNISERIKTEHSLKEAFTRTQLLYNISEALTTLIDRQAAFETVLGEFLLLLKLHQGRIILYDLTSGSNKIEAQYLDDKVIHSTHSWPNIEDDLAQYIVQNPFPVIIEDVSKHPLTTNRQEFWNSAESILLTPLLVKGDVVGVMAAEAHETGHEFAQSDIEASKMVADQLGIWLENHQLLAETQHRSNLLQTAAEISKAASSILEVDDLINTSVNLIRNQFDFYYVGLFIVDKTGEWAILRAGTGEAGRVQLAKGHRLKIGGESMIGWSIQNHQPRIALDVGREAVHFQNPDLPETRSEMALPLISREQVIGALTVQSEKPGAFSEEDITVLQTMTDQLANAIGNARLFESVTRSQQAAESLLQETQALQQFSQALAGTLRLNEILNLFFQACTHEIGFDYVMLSLVDKYQYRVKAIAGVGVSENYIKQTNKSLDSDDIAADIIRTGQTEVITGWDDRFDRELFEIEGHTDWMRLFTPITLRQENIGLVEAGFNKNAGANIDDSEIRLLRAFVDQIALAIENSQRFEASQRAARREALIKEITTKVRASTDLDQILQTTVKEIGDAIGSKRAYVQLISPKNGEAEKSK